VAIAMTAEYRSEAEALADALPPPGARFDLPGGESTSAALHRAEQERDEAIRERDSLARRCALRFEETEKLRAELASARTEVDVLRRTEAVEIDRLCTELDAARRDLAIARHDLDMARNNREQLEVALTRRETALAEARQEINKLTQETT
jgi:chromosome segregation ATPase